MRSTLLSSVAALALCFSSALAVSAQTNPPPDLVKAMEARSVADTTGNLETWGRYTADDFVAVGTMGRLVTRADRAALIKTRKPGGTDASKMTEETFRVYGDTVIHTALQQGPPGSPIRFTSVWVKQNGQWRVVSITQTPIVKAQ